MQNPKVSSQNPESLNLTTGFRILASDYYYLILVKDLGYGDVQELRSLIEEVSKLLESYSQTIQHSGF